MSEETKTDYCGQHGFGYDSGCEKCKKLLDDSSRSPGCYVQPQEQALRDEINTMHQEKLDRNSNQGVDIENAKHDALAVMSFHNCSDKAAEEIAGIFENLKRT